MLHIFFVVKQGRNLGKVEELCVSREPRGSDVETEPLPVFLLEIDTIFFLYL